MRALVIAAVAFLCIFPAQAQEVENLQDLLADKTYWSLHFPERYYFSPDGMLLIQYMEDTPSYPAGAVRTGTWQATKKGELCWTLKDEDIEYCFSVTEDLLAPRPWHMYDNNFSLKQTGGGLQINWDRWINGNLIAKPDVYQRIAKGTLPILDKESYVADITDKIMHLPMSAVYHRADGRAFWVDEETAAMIENNPDVVTSGAVLKRKTTVTGTWSLDTGRHCYDWEGGYTRTCITVFSGNDLYRPQQGWVQIMDDTFIRLIKPSHLKKTAE